MFVLRLSLDIEYLCYFRAMISLNWRRRLQWYIWIANVHVDMEEDRGVRWFRRPKTEEEERLLLDSTVPKNTQHNAKWAVKVFEEWQSSRRDKAPRQLASSLTALDLTNIPDLIRNAESLNLWLSRFVEEREVIK